MPTRTTVYLEEDLLDRLRQLLPPRGLNRFVNQAVAEKIAALERAQIEAAMAEGYLATRADRAALAREWDAVDHEDWPA